MTITQSQYPKMQTYSSMLHYQMNSSDRYNKSDAERSQESLQRDLRKYNLPLRPSFKQVMNINEYDKEFTALVRKGLIREFPHLANDVLDYFDEWLEEEMRRIDPNDREYDPNHVKSLDKYSCPGISFVFSNSYISDDAKKEKLRKFLDAVYPEGFLKDHMFRDNGKFDYVMKVFIKIFGKMGFFSDPVEEFLGSEVKKNNQLVLFMCSTGYLRRANMNEFTDMSRNQLCRLPLSFKGPFPSSFFKDGYHFDLYLQKALSHFTEAVEVFPVNDACYNVETSEAKKDVYPAYAECSYKAEDKGVGRDVLDAKAGAKGEPIYVLDSKSSEQVEVVEAIALCTLDAKSSIGNKVKVEEVKAMLKFCDAWRRSLGLPKNKIIDKYLTRVEEWL